MKWNPDKAFAQLEATLPTNAPGTELRRIVMETRVMPEHGLKPKTADVAAGQGLVWCLAIGVMQMPKRFFYGRTIREAYLKARRALLKRKPKPSSGDASRRRPRLPSA